MYWMSSEWFSKGLAIPAFCLISFKSFSSHWDSQSLDVHSHRLPSCGLKESCFDAAVACCWITNKGILQALLFSWKSFVLFLNNCSSKFFFLKSGIDYVNQPSLGFSCHFQSAYMLIAVLGLAVVQWLCKKPLASLSRSALQVMRFIYFLLSWQSLDLLWWNSDTSAWKLCMWNGCFCKSWSTWAGFSFLRAAVALGWKLRLCLACYKRGLPFAPLPFLPQSAEARL